MSHEKIQPAQQKNFPMRNKTKILSLLLCSIVFFASCHSKHQQVEPQHTGFEKMLIDLVESRYDYCCQLTDSDEITCKNADDIMTKCNRLLSGEEPYWKKHLELLTLMKTYGIDQSKIDSVDFAVAVRTIQLFALEQEIEGYYNSHFEVDAIGLEYAGDFYDKKGNRVVRLLPNYICRNTDHNPVYYVNGEKMDTDGTFWYYKPNNFDSILHCEVDAWRWGELHRYHCGVKLSFPHTK